MEMLAQFRDGDRVAHVIQKIRQISKHKWVIMEVCGGQTHSIMHYGLQDLLPEQVELVHGPGCPVCVTPLELIDKALTIAALPNVIFTSFGDMLRVPGSSKDLFKIKAEGGQVRIVYSPLDAVKIARENPDKEVVFFAVGFETTAPPNVMSVLQAKALGLKNYSILTSHVRVPPAMHAILSSSANRVQGFLAAGHVCAVMGYHEYPSIANQYQIPITVTGFEPLDLVNGLYHNIQQLENGTWQVENAYPRSVTFEGNQPAQKMIADVFEPCDRQWRGIGMIPMSGWRLNDSFSEYDAEKKFQVESIQVKEPEVCIAGLILQGHKKPFECPAFGKECTPTHPLGATMVSSEGTCSAYFEYARREEDHV